MSPYFIGYKFTGIVNNLLKNDHIKSITVNVLLNRDKCSLRIIHIDYFCARNRLKGYTPLQF